MGNTRNIRIQIERLSGETFQIGVHRKFEQMERYNLYVFFPYFVPSFLIFFFFRLPSHLIHFVSRLQLERLQELCAAIRIIYCNFTQLSCTRQTQRSSVSNVHSNNREGGISKLKTLHVKGLSYLTYRPKDKVVQLLYIQNRFSSIKLQECQVVRNTACSLRTQDTVTFSLHFRKQNPTNVTHCRILNYFVKIRYACWKLFQSHIKFHGTK